MRLTKTRVTFLAFALSCATPLFAQTTQPSAPLLQGLGNHHFQITSQSGQSQRFFDQGLILAYAFNHKEAGRAFAEAERLDPECAMAYWGQALVLGPHVNAAMKPEDAPKAWVRSGAGLAAG